MEERESPLVNIFDHAFPLADKLSLEINKSINQMVSENKITNLTSDAIILHTVAMMLMICMMNREVLESNELDTTFRKVKGVTHDYLVHVLNLERDRKGEGDDDPTESDTPTLNS